MNRKIPSVLPSTASIPSSSSLFRPFSNQNRPSPPLVSSSSSSAATAATTTTSLDAIPTTQILLWRYQIFDPDSDIVAHWNYVFLFSCLIALFLDPLYFYLPSVGGPACLQTDQTSLAWITFFRSVADLFYCMHMVMKFRTAFVSPSSRVFGRGDLVMDPKEIAMRYLKSDFLIDLAALLPLPQIVVFLVIGAGSDSNADYANTTLILMVLLQYIPRLFVIFPLNQRIIKSAGVVAKTDWAGAAYNLLLFLLASHVLGATWYTISLSQQFSCWKSQCFEENMSRVLCIPDFLDCRTLHELERQNWYNLTKVEFNCDAKRAEEIPFKFGMFIDCLKDEVGSSTLYNKILYCLWWGLRSLSSYGQELDTSIHSGENLFAIIICIAGSVLFALLVGNMQTYFQSMSIKLEEWRIRRRDTEEWMRHRQLPEDLQERVRQFVQYKWLATRGVDEESILRSLPVDLRREIQRHLCIALVRRVPFFSQMDDQLLDAICERLVSSLSIKGTYIVREGDPVNEMVFIIRGKLESSTTNGGRTGFFNSITLRPGDFCGEELLTWALMPNSSLNLPSSTRTVRAITEVEAFALQAEDLKFVAHQFKRLHSKKLQHAFRYYSHQWRTWASCYLQSAWRRYKKRKLAKELSIRERRFAYLQIPDQDSYYEVAGGAGIHEHGGRGRTVRAAHNPTGFQNLGATILASKFAKTTRRGANQQKVHVVESASSSLNITPLSKPDEPDFSADHDLV